MRTSRDLGSKKSYLIMPFIFFAFCILLIPGGLWGRTTNITTLPYTASQAGTAYSETLTVNGTCLTSSTNGINFTGHDIVLLLAGDTLKFGTGGASGLYGLYFSSGSNHIKVEGGWVIHGITNDTQSDGVRDVTFNGGPHDIYIHNTNFKVSGDNAHCIDSYAQGTSLYNIEIDGGQYWSYCRRYTSRCNYDGAAIRLESSNSNGNFNFKIHGINLKLGPGQGMVAMGRLSPATRAIVYACTLSVDHRNDMYPTDDGDVCHNSANPYALHLRFVGAGSSIHDNVIRSGSLYGGGRGIMIENASGTPSSYVDVYNNDCVTHEGPNIHYGEDFQNFGLRIRPMDGGTVVYLHVYNNKFDISGDTDPATHDYGSHPIAGCYSGDTPNSHITIEGNLFKAYAYTGSGTKSKAFMFDAATGDSTFIFRNNKLQSDRYILKFGDYNDGSSNLCLTNDTLGFVSPRQTDAHTYHIGELSNPWVCTRDIAKDIVYQNGATDTNIVFATGGTLDFTLQKTVFVHVIGRDNLPVSGAAVTATNHYGRNTFTGTTDTQGNFSGPVTYWYESFSGADSTGFNNFTLKARKLTDSTTVSYTVNPTCLTAVVTLANTGGNPAPPDTIPPGRINDLGGQPGIDGGQGSLDLTPSDHSHFSKGADSFAVKSARDPFRTE